MMMIDAYTLAERFIGIREVPGAEDSPFVMSMLKLDATWPEHDEVPWCSAFVNYVTWLLRLPRSKSLRARSWLLVGRAVPLAKANIGFDVVILSRGKGEQPGPDIIKAPGHVGFFGGYERGKVLMLGGNQGNAVNVRSFDHKRILGIRRLGVA